MKLNLDLIDSLKCAKEYSVIPNQTEIKCTKLEETELSPFQNITAILGNPKAIEAGLFESNYVTYQITTQELGWIVNRRFSDFVLLRESLLKIFPQIFIPPLPKKRMGFGRYDIDFIEMRMTSLQNFLTKILKNENIKSCPLTVNFLKETKRDIFEEKFKAYHYDKFYNVLNIKNTLGKFYVNTKDESDFIYKFENETSFLKYHNKLLNKLDHDLRKFDFYFEDAIRKLKDIEKDFEMLSLLNNRTYNPTNNEMSISFFELSCYFKNWNRILFNQSLSINNHLQDFFKNARKEAEAFKEFFEFKENLKKVYEEKRIKLVKKKEKLINVKDINLWEITEEIKDEERDLIGRDKNFTLSKMCTNDTNEVNNIKIIVQYLNQRFQEELDSYINRFNVDLIKNVISFCDEIFPSLNDNISIWSSLRSFSNINEEK